MILEELNSRVGAFVDSSESTGLYITTGVPGLWIYENPNTTPIDAVIFHPIVSLTLQGEKETRLGQKIEFFRPGETLIVSHDLPMRSKVTRASPTKPFLAISLDLDLTLLRSLRSEFASSVAIDKHVDTIQSHPADPGFVDALNRYFQLHRSVREIELLGPILYRELHARLLLAPHAGMLRRLLDGDSHASQIARAIAHIRKNLVEAVSVEELSKIAGMSVRSFHEHFKRITETTPLQYQKELRLIEAKRLLQGTEHTVGSTAFEIGYESPTQFSRDYSRRFGVSPREHLKECQ